MKKAQSEINDKFTYLNRKNHNLRIIKYDNQIDQ